VFFILLKELTAHVYMLSDRVKNHQSL